MKSLNIVNCILVLLIVLGIYYAFIHTGENYYYNQWMENACGKFDCSTPEGAKQATEECNRTFTTDPSYNKNEERLCNSSDDVFRGMCNEPCNVEDVYPFLVQGEKGRLLVTTCKQPEMTRVNEYGDIECRNVLDDNWTIKKTKKQIDKEEAEKKAAEEAEKKAAEEAAKKAEAKEYYRYTF